MNKDYPLVTIVSPCYNHSKYVIESLESIKKQTYPNIEHIIIDDCSTDDSTLKIESWINQNKYKCVFIKHKKNVGISSTLNESIRISKGEFWTGLATDDIAVPDRTKYFVDFITKTRAYMVTSDCMFIDEQGNSMFINGNDSFLEHYSVFNDTAKSNYGTYCSLLRGNYIPSSLIIRKSIFSKIGLFDEELTVEDWDMWLRIAQHSTILYIDKKLVKYRFHDNNSIGNSTILSNNYIKVLVKQGFIPIKKGCGKYFIKQVRKVYKENSRDLWGDDNYSLFRNSMVSMFIFDYILIRFIKKTILQIKLIITYKILKK